MRFSGKTVIVTGAGGGIGEAYAVALAREGGNVVIADINEAGAAAIAAKINEFGNAIFVKTDVASVDSVQAMVDEAASRYGGVDLLINNAAIYGGRRNEPIHSVDLDYYEHFMRVNVTGALIVTRAVYPLMAERGGGAIVNQSSIGAYMNSNHYGLSKAAINGLTTVLAKELGPLNIRVNAIAPGPVDTQATRDTVPADRMGGLLANMALGRMGQPEDIVGACLFLLSSDSAWITGQILCVDGGIVVRH